MSHADKNRTIWCLMDGKTGHQNQILGLAESLQQHASLDIRHVDISGRRKRTKTLYANADAISGSPDHPALVIGAGHRSHIPLCVLKKRFQSKSIVLMKPSLPLSWFDLCLVPSVHNLSLPPANVVLTKGVLNRVTPRNLAPQNTGICLIGGPSSHYEWSDRNTLRQLKPIIADQSRKWTIATSRRTPQSFLEQLAETATHANVVTPDETGPDWLPQTLAASEIAWVTEDSVSMMYEALTSGATVGVIELSRKRSNRVTECTDSLVREGDVTRWHHWRRTKQLLQNAHTLHEAKRCAAEVINRGLLPVKASIKAAA